MIEPTEDMIRVVRECAGVGEIAARLAAAAVRAIAEREHRAAAEQLVADLKRISESCRWSAGCTAPELLPEKIRHHTRSAAFARAAELAEETLLRGVVACGMELAHDGHEFRDESGPDREFRPARWCGGRGA